jgi:hypothetical protein
MPLLRGELSVAAAAGQVLAGLGSPNADVRGE